jgi:hypothetical protein
MAPLRLCALWSAPKRSPLLASCQGSLFEWSLPFKHPLKLRARPAQEFMPKAIWSSSVNDIWVLELRPLRHRVYRFDPRGKKLKVVNQGLPQACEYRAIAGTAANDIWLVGEKGCVAHFDGAEWSEVPSGFEERLNGVWAATPSCAWAIGVGGTILHWDGKAWHRQESDTLKDLLAISGNSEQDVWVVGEAGTVLHRSTP